MWETTQDAEYLKRAIFFYGKGFQIRKDYYNGENYALCLNFAASIETDNEEKIYYNVAAKKARIKIIETLSDLTSPNTSINSEYKWAYATISNCHYGLMNQEQGQKYEDIFISLTEVTWEKDTFLKSKKQLIDLIG